MPLTPNFSLITFSFSFLNRLDKLNNGIAIGFRQLVELLGGSIAIRLLGVAMPHDGLDDGAGPAVVQTIVGTGEPVGG